MRHGSRRLSAGRGPKRGKAEVGQVPVGRLGLVNATDLDGALSRGLRPACRAGDTRALTRWPLAGRQRRRLAR